MQSVAGGRRGRPRRHRRRVGEDADIEGEQLGDRLAPSNETTLRPRPRNGPTQSSRSARSPLTAAPTLAKAEMSTIGYLLDFEARNHGAGDLARAAALPATARHHSVQVRPCSPYRAHSSADGRRWSTRAGSNHICRTRRYSCTRPARRYKRLRWRDRSRSGRAATTQWSERFTYPAGSRARRGKWRCGARCRRGQVGTHCR